MNWSMLAAVLSASLVGSVHCAGMCGPFVAVYSAAGPRDHEGWGQKALAHGGYHGGRLLTYTLLGALAGSAGAAIDWAGQAAGLVQFSMLLTSLLIIVWGVGVIFPRLRIKSPVSRYMGPQLACLGSKPRIFRASLLGAFTPLLPCGWLYAFVITAAGMGSLLGGALVMTAFWAGTVPALLGMGTALSSVGRFLRNRAPVVTGIALIIVGLVGVVSRASMPLPVQDSPQGQLHHERDQVPQKAACH